MCKPKIVFDQVMPKKLCLLLYHKLFFIVEQSINIVLLTLQISRAKSLMLRRVWKALLNKLKCSSGLPEIKKVSFEQVIVSDVHSYLHFGSQALYSLKAEMNEQDFFGATSVIGNYLNNVWHILPHIQT